MLNIINRLIHDDYRNPGILEVILDYTREYTVKYPEKVLKNLKKNESNFLYYTIYTKAGKEQAKEFNPKDKDIHVINKLIHIIDNNSDYFWHFVGKDLISEYHDTPLSWYFDTWGLDNILDMLNNIKENCKGQPHYEDNVKILEDEYFLSEVDKYKKQKNNAADEAKGKNV